jgi:hypothetical protein
VVTRRASGSSAAAAAEALAALILGEMGPVRIAIVSTVVIFLVVVFPFGLLIWLVWVHSRSTKRDEVMHGPMGSFTGRKRASSVRKQFLDLTARKSSEESWPTTVIDLARAYAKDEDCGFALHDALLEAGKTEEAKAFQVPDHPLRFTTVKQILGDSDADG